MRARPNCGKSRKASPSIAIRISPGLASMLFPRYWTLGCKGGSREKPLKWSRRRRFRSASDGEMACWRPEGLVLFGLMSITGSRPSQYEHPGAGRLHQHHRGIIFDHALRQGLAAQLAQPLALMGIDKDTRLTAEIVREVCERTGKAVVIDGSIVSLGNQYVLSMRATSCHTSEIVNTEQAQADSKEHVLDVIAQSAAKLCWHLGESLWTPSRNTMRRRRRSPRLLGQLCRLTASVSGSMLSNSMRREPQRCSRERLRSIQSLPWRTRGSPFVTSIWANRPRQRKICAKPTGCAITSASMKVCSFSRFTTNS